MTRGRDERCCRADLAQKIILNIIKSMYYIALCYFLFLTQIFLKFNLFLRIFSENIHTLALESVLFKLADEPPKPNKGLFKVTTLSFVVNKFPD